jgi:starvation-inducible DNA-binding protein
MDKSRPCVEALKQGLSDSFTMYFMAHAYHWNVEGPDFHEYHEFFATIYEDIFGSVDLWAENIRKLGAMAPQSLAEVGMPSKIEEEYVSSDPLEMSMALYRANEVVIESINVAFAIADEINEQGIADFLAARDDMHKKWRWQLNSITGMGNKEEDIEPMPMSDEPQGVAYDVNGEAEYAEYSNAMQDDLIFFGDRAEKMLSERIERHNRRAPSALQASAEVVKAVYRRGALTASGSMTRDQSGINRVDAFLRLLSAGRPSNPLYTADNDLLPESHKRSTAKDAALVASAAVSELSIPSLTDIEKPEDFVLALTELSGLGYDAEPAIRASWMRAVNTGESPRDRAMELAMKKYESKDADLLPAQ